MSHAPPDNRLHQLGEIYRRNAALREACTFAQFVHDPDRYLAAHLTPATEPHGPRPLLPAQERLRLRVLETDLLRDTARALQLRWVA